MAATVAPSIAGYAGAHRSPGMAPANVIPHPSYMRHVSHYGYPQRSMSLMSGRDYGTHSRTNSPRANGHVIENGHADSDDHSHDPVRLLQRIEKVMPDLSRLLHSYKDTQSKLVSREAEAQQIQAQHDQTLMQRDFYIEALQGQIKKSANENVEEFSKLRKKIDDHRQGLDNLQEKHRDIEENLKTSRKENEELVQSKIQLEEEISKLQDKIQSREQELQELHERDLEELKEDQKASRTAEKEDLTNLFEEIRNEEERTAAEKLEAREKELLDQQESLRAEWEAQKQQLEEAHTALQLEYDTKLSDKQAELDSKIEALTSVEAQLGSKQTELESKAAELESKQSELDTAQTELESKRAMVESKVVELAAMQDKLDSTQTELEMKRAEIESKQQELESTHAQLSEKQSALEAMERELEEMRQEHAAEFEETRQRHASALEEAHQNHTKELQDAHQNNASQLEEARENHTKDLQDVHQNHASQLEETRQGHARELGDTHQNHANEIDGVRQSHADELETLNNTHQNELESLRGSHSAELEGLRDTHTREVDAAVKDAVERLQATVAEHEQRERSWDTTRAELERQLSEKTDDLESLEREKEALERDDLSREKTLLTAVDDMRRTIDNMENDREKLRKTLQSLGEATDLKSSKGDQFFLESFGQLSQLIVDLSKEHFAYLPIDPPKDILEKIPPEMPSFLDNTSASCELRAAYVQHVISKTLTYRIFQPFLFTLGRRYDKADTFFHVLSMDIRRKSVRREAFWRQQTLKAAYTTSDAKQSINVVAAVIVDEIVDHIRHFADPKKLDALIQAVRKVVKLAAETWRHARVERELVLATMPAPVADKVSNDEWKEYTCDRSVVAHENGESARHVLLRLFPRIYREAAHEDFADDKEKVNPCVYSPGMVIYSDSPSVLARRDELARRATDSGIEVNGIEAHE
jgi:chromosome segregation ATPase